MKKLPLELVPTALIESCARAMAEGRLTHGSWEWRENGVSAMAKVGSLLRHLHAWINGTEIDFDSPLLKHHLDGVAGSLAVLLDAASTGTLIDDRPRQPNASNG